MIYDMAYESNICIYMFHDSLDTVASASYVLASASQKIIGLGLGLTLSGLDLGLILLWPH